jgi:hypothetical protein
MDIEKMELRIEELKQVAMNLHASIMNDQRDLDETNLLIQAYTNSIKVKEQENEEQNT